MRKSLLPVVLAAVAFSGLAVPPAAAAPPAAPTAAAETRTPPRPPSRLQVRFKDGASASARDAALAKARGRGHAVRVDRSLRALNAAVLRVSNPRAVQALLREDPAVAYVEPESRYLPAAEAPQPERAEIGVATFQAAPNPNRGAGKVIAVIDSPVSTSPSVTDLSGKVTALPPFTSDYREEPGDPFYDSPCTATACPHGTAVASVAAGKADGTGMVGVAPDAAIRSYDVFRQWTYTDPDTGEQTTWSSAGSADIADAVVALAQHAASNPNLVAVNMSMESEFDNRLMRDALAYLHATAPHVTIVAAAGNDGSERANFPAGDPYVLSVGATGQVPDTSPCSTPVAADAPWSVVGFSNRGDVDVVAPGHCVTAWDYVDTNGNSVPDKFGVSKVSGTSFAAPMVAGMAALLASATPSVTGDAARAAIIASAAGPKSVTSGAGKANAEAALTLAGGTAPYTAVTLVRGGQVATKVGRRQVEVLHVDPAGGSPAAPAPAVTSGYGTLTPSSPAAPAAPAQAGLDRDYYSYAVPASDQTGATFSITAGGAAVPLKMLPAYDSFEGVPAATGENGTAKLKHGVNGGYVRSAYVRSGTRLTFAWTFGHATSSVPPGATLNLWEPATAGGAADAASEPVWQFAAGAERSDWNYVIPGSDDCGYEADGRTLRPCRRGRYLVGFLTGSSRDNSSSTRTYALKLTYAGPTAKATAPAVASSASVSGPFKVSWGGNSYATAFDVSYAVKTKTSTGWRVTAWQPWRTQVGAGSAYFGLGGTPTAIVPGRTYHFRVQAWDGLGNHSLPRVAATVVPYDDRSGAVAYSAGWTRVGVSDRWLKTATKTSTANARASLTTDASAFTIVGDRCATCGQFKVYVDGVYKKTVDTYRSSGTSVRRVLWSSGSLGGVKSHRVTIIVVGTKGRPKVVLDGIAATR